MLSESLCSLLTIRKENGRNLAELNSEVMVRMAGDAVLVYV